MIELTHNSKRFNKEVWDDNYLKLKDFTSERIFEYFLEKELTKKLESFEPEVIVFKKQYEEVLGFRKSLNALYLYDDIYYAVIWVRLDPDFEIRHSSSIFDRDGFLIGFPKGDKINEMSKILVDEMLRWDDVRLASLTGQVKIF
jgi:hypothetical protein